MKPAEILTKTENEIARSVALGDSLKMIAAGRYRSIETIKTHIKNICKKLDARGVVDVTRIYVLEHPEFFKNLIVAFFISVQSFIVMCSVDVDLRRHSNSSRIVRVSRKNKNEA